VTLNIMERQHYDMNRNDKRWQMQPKLSKVVIRGEELSACKKTSERRRL